MRRALGDAVAIDRAGVALRRAALVIALGLAVMSPAAVRGGEPSAADRVGRRVVARFGRLALLDDRGAVAGVGGESQVYRVERVDRRRLWLRAEGKALSGWAPTDAVEVVGPLADPSVRRADARPDDGPGPGPDLAAPLRHVRSDATLIHARVAIERKDLDRAIAACTEAIRIDPDRAEAYALRGEVWLSKDQMARALADLTEAIRLDRRDASAYGRRADAWWQMKEFERAIADLDQAIALDPEDGDAYVGRGGAWIEKGEPDKALVDLTRAIEIDPGNAKAHAVRADAWEKKHAHDAAIADAGEAIRLDPRYATAYRVRASAWVGKNEPDWAMADLDEAIRLDPLDAGSRSQRGFIWKVKGEYDKALADLEAATRLNPDDASSHNNLAWYRATCPDATYRDGKRAVESATRACELTEWKDANNLDTLAAAYAESGDFDAAVKWQARSIALLPEDEKSEAEARLTLYRSRTPYRDNRP